MSGFNFTSLLRLMELRASRRQLAELDDASLKDIGISRAQAMFEASRSAWDDMQVSEERASFLKKRSKKLSSV